MTAPSTLANVGEPRGLIKKLSFRIERNKRRFRVEYKKMSLQTQAKVIYNFPSDLNGLLNILQVCVGQSRATAQLEDSRQDCFVFACYWKTLVSKVGSVDYLPCASEYHIRKRALWLSTCYIIKKQ